MSDIEYKFRDKNTCQASAKYFRCIGWQGDWFNIGEIYPAVIAPENSLFKSYYANEPFKIGIKLPRSEGGVAHINPYMTGEWIEVTEEDFNCQQNDLKRATNWISSEMVMPETIQKLIDEAFKKHLKE